MNVICKRAGVRAQFTIFIGDIFFRYKLNLWATTTHTHASSPAITYIYTIHHTDNNAAHICGVNKSFQTCTHPHIKRARIENDITALNKCTVDTTQHTIHIRYVFVCGLWKALKSRPKAHIYVECAVHARSSFCKMCVRRKENQKMFLIFPRHNAQIVLCVGHMCTYAVKAWLDMCFLKCLYVHIYELF